ncbi:DUF992 domain-containing protein [Roseibium algae]|uniref:DUF992 domain-containing protein n=1 Tax=Roseibium algae TaxID=3123038 RepID=A0ABU8TEP2_9HYPH
MFPRATLALIAISGSLLVSPALAEDKGPGVTVGTLTCSIEGESSFIVGSTSTLACNYKPAGDGPVQFYAGTIKEYGLDIGKTSDATLVWGVLAPSADMDPGALAGNYAGLTAGAGIGAGISANALIGGLDKSIALNPFSLASQTGTNLTLGVSKLTLTAVE